MKKYDFLVIGGGIFGLYTASYLSKKNEKVCVVEKEASPMQKASIVNQARIHSGYHYPRSIATALISNEYKERFITDHKKFINKKYRKYYAIDKLASLTSSLQFEKFCNFLNIKCKEVSKIDYINFNRLDKLFLTEEFSFDPIMIAEYYKEKVRQDINVNLEVNTTIIEAERLNDSWLVTLYNHKNNEYKKIEAKSVINATYHSINSINKLFEMPSIKLMHEITEMAFVSVPKIKDIGLTIMDGQFCSIMPYGLSGLHSLYSVSYSVHSVDYHSEPKFNCQKINKNCLPNFISICNICKDKPISNNYKMQKQLANYLSEDVRIQYQFSMYAIRSKLQYNYIDDGRPTEVTKMNSKPEYYCLFSGKINSIYEIESKLDYE
jgi:hypothetical protein